MAYDKRMVHRARLFSMKYLTLVLLTSVIVLSGSFTSPSYRMARLKYGGGGDWYGSRTALTNLAAYCNEHLNTNFYPDEATVEPGSDELFHYPYIFATGHGNIVFSEQEAENLRKYLTGGGFVHFCDNYGFDEHLRREIKKVFPEQEFVELPPSHRIFRDPNRFPEGLPKIHEHDNKRPQAFGIFWEGRLVCFYDYECDLGNGWEDAGTYPDDTPGIREKALRMGANLIQYALTH